ncbi:hypothetical protein ACLESD_01780 [Pyxidicoccus sp. 3LFB2]
MLYHRQQLGNAGQYERQLRGELSDKERQLQALDARLHLASSKLTTQQELEDQYQTQLAQRDRELEDFRRQHQLQVRSLSTSVHSLSQTVRNGTTEVRGLPPASAPDGTSAPERPIISYTYAAPNGRIQLSDPDIQSPGDETLTLSQRFLVEGVVFQQADGALMTERLSLSEVTPRADGSWEVLAEAELVDARFTYASAPPPASSPARGLLSLSLMATMGTTFQSDRAVVSGLSLHLLRLGRFGLATGLLSDFGSLEGTGASAFLTWRPSLAGRDLNVLLGVGLHLPLATPARILPTLNVSFILL